MSRSPTRWASAATTAASCSGGFDVLHRRAIGRGVRDGALVVERGAVLAPRRGNACENDRAADDGRPARGTVPRRARPCAACEADPRDRDVHRVLVDLYGARA